MLSLKTGMFSEDWNVVSETLNVVFEDWNAVSETLNVVSEGWNVVFRQCQR